MRWLALAPLLYLTGTVLHEGAHALAVVLDGGTVLDVTIGLHASHVLHDGVARPWLVWLAPSLLWSTTLVASALFFPRARRLRVALIVPAVDLLYSVGGLVAGDPTADLSRALHGHELAAGLAIAALAALVLLRCRHAA